MILAELSLGERFERLLSFQDYNTWVPLLATALLGLSAGVVGTFIVLRRRALVGDVVGHAALPGIVLAFLMQELWLGGSGRSTPVLLTGALLTGLGGAGCVLLIDRFSKARSDAALAIVLSLFYGAGAVLLTMAQKIDTGSQAGLKTYLSGKTASLVADDVWLSASLATALLVLTLLLFKEWTLLCFDEGFCAAQGYPAVWLDALLIALAAVVSVLGMQSVGLVLVVGLLIIPPAAARFWTDDIRWMAAAAGLIGAGSGALGVALSSLVPKFATGPTVILCAAGAFVVSLIAGRRRGFLWRWLDQRRLRAESARQDLLRTAFEAIESRLQKVPGVNDLQATDLTLNVWTAQLSGGERPLRWTVALAVRDGLLAEVPGGYRLTAAGAAAAAQTARNHRLWELYLLQYADVAPAHVHRHADAIEHVLDQNLVAELESLLAKRTQ